MAEKWMDLYFRWLIICGATLTLASSLTATDTLKANKTKAANWAATSAMNGVVLYEVTDHHGTCILLKVDGHIEIHYKAYIGEQAVETYMMQDAVIEGSCKYEDMSTMRIAWEGYTMIWNFAKTPGGERWYVSEVELIVSAELEAFHSIKSYVLPETSFKLTHTQMLFMTPVGKSYACTESDIFLSFPEGEYNPAGLYGMVFLKTLQLQPFMYKGSYFDPAFDCSSRLASRHKTSPIVGGSVLGVAVLVTIVGYGVFRYVKTKSTTQ